MYSFTDLRSSIRSSIRIGFDAAGKSNASLTNSPEKVMAVYFFA